MFSENRKISDRQVFRLLTYDLLGIGTLLLPSALAGCAAEDGIFCLAAGIFLALGYVKILALLCRKMQESYVRELFGQYKKIVGGLLLWMYFCYFVWTASYTAYIFGVLITNNLVEHIGYRTVLFLLLLFTFYGMMGGIEGRARIYELLFWILMIPFFMMLLSAGREVDADYWGPVFATGFLKGMQGSLLAGSFFSSLTILPFLKEYTHEEKLGKMAEKAVCFSGVIFVALYLILEGIFGSTALKSMRFPVVTMMSSVQTGGGFLKRTDAFMFGIWFFTLYALLNSMVFYAGNIVKEIWTETVFKKMQAEKREKRKGQLEKGCDLIVVLLVYLGAYLLFRYEEVFAFTQTVLWKAGFVFVTAVPVVLLLLKKREKNRRKCRKAGVMILFFGALFLQGCGTVELEDKEFPVLLTVSDEEQFEKNWMNYKYEKNKVIDYRHLKVILIEETFLENEAQMNGLLNVLQKENEIPWNTYVMVTKDCEAMEQKEADMEDVLGTYLEELLENTSGIRQKKYATLGTLYKEQKNHKETCFLPYVELDCGKPVIGAYQVWKRGKADAVVDVRTAKTAFLTQNGMEEFVTELTGHSYAELTDPHSRIRLLDATDQYGRRIRLVTVTLTGEGTVQGIRENTATEAEKEKWNDLLREQFETTAEEALKQGIDVTNSYKKLGSCKRSWYAEYQNMPGQYEEDIEIKYQVDIHWND